MKPPRYTFLALKFKVFRGQSLCSAFVSEADAISFILDQRRGIDPEAEDWPIFELYGPDWTLIEVK